LFASTNNIVR